MVRCTTRPKTIRRRRPYFRISDDPGEVNRMTPKKPTKAGTKTAAERKTKSRRRKPSLSSDVLAFIESDQVDRIARYADGGRHHRHLSDQVLIEAWKSAFRAMADDPYSAELRALENDLNCEIALRGLKAPIEDVDDARKRLASKVSEPVDPDASAKFAAGLERDFAAFRAKRDRSN
jgi:hypothetical protein